jgi:hypothetical protein
LAHIQFGKLSPCNGHSLLLAESLSGRKLPIAAIAIAFYAKGREIFDIETYLFRRDILYLVCKEDIILALNSEKAVEEIEKSYPHVEFVPIFPSSCRLIMPEA